jgi:ABC-type transporter Mla MlaB component
MALRDATGRLSLSQVLDSKHALSLLRWRSEELARHFQLRTAVTLKISATGPAKLKLDGALTGEEGPELRRACGGVKGRLALDLTDLRSVDRQGVGVLRELRAQGAEIVGASPYIELLLGTTATEGNKQE